MQSRRAVGAVDANYEVHQRVKAPTPTGGPDAVLTTIADLVHSLDAAPIAGWASRVSYPKDRC